MPVASSIDNDGVQLAITVEGEGPDVLFVHGLGSAQVLWNPFVAALSDRYRCWNLDLRGHGASDRAPGAYGRTDYGSDVQAALEYIGAPTIGVGHSLGGSSLIFAATEQHEFLRSIYVIDSRLFQMDGLAEPIVALFERQLAMLREFQPANRPVSDYEEVLANAPASTGGTNRDAMIPEQLFGRAESLSQLDPECIEATLSNRLATALVEPRIPIPVRVLGGDSERGASLLPEHIDMLLSLTPHAEVDHLTGVGHQMMMMRGFDDLVLADLEHWLTAQ